MTSRSPSAAKLRLLLRELGAELAQLNHRVGTHTELRDGDLACLDLLAREGPLSPSALARLMHLHPATMTGVLDRLEKSGWIGRERDQSDRRAVLIRAIGGRARELMGLYAGMNEAIDRIAARYDGNEIAVINDFLVRLIEAGRAANAALARD